jgi:hypothetical protein
MKLPRYSLRSLMVLATLAGASIAVCREWPVQSVWYRRGQPPIQISGLQMQFAGDVIRKRPPTDWEWAARSAFACTALTIGFVAVSYWRDKGV